MRIYVKRDTHDTSTDMWEFFGALKDLTPKLSLPPTVYVLGYEDRHWDDWDHSVSYLAEVIEDDKLVKLRRVR